jgi:hypothetical protein
LDKWTMIGVAAICGIMASLALGIDYAIRVELSLRRVVQGQVSDAIFTPQSLVTNWCTDTTLVQFYGGAKIEFIGKELDRVTIGKQIRITYHRVLIWGKIYNEILEVEEL